MMRSATVTARRGADALAIGLLVLIGVAALAACVPTARVTVASMLRVDAGQAAELLAGEIGAAFVAAGGRSEPAALAAEIGERLSARPFMARVVDFTVYDRFGAPRASRRAPERAGLRGSIAPQASAETVIETLGGARRVVLADADAAGRSLATASVPVEVPGMRVGALVAVLDVTETRALFDRGVLVVAALLGVATWLAIGLAILIVWRRMAAESQAERRMRHLAHHDALTDLPNRIEFDQRLVQALARARRHGGKVAVMCVDLDRFKQVNDAFGHAGGDELLRSAATRLIGALRESDTIGRLGGDVFSVLAEDIQSGEDAMIVARRLCEAMMEPHRVAGRAVDCTVSVGIALGPEDGAGPDELMRNAGLALARAKQDGRCTFRFFEAGMDAVQQHRLRLTQDLRTALERDEFELHYQPQFEVEGGRLIGNEALLRWNHPELGQVPPAHFIPIAENSGLIVALGLWALRHACLEAAGWPAHLKVAVNLSPAQFKTDDVVRSVAGVLEETGLAPQRLELEITESLLLSDTDAVLRQLAGLDALGVGIAMDDFGTGYSSLSYLARFRFSKIKIDRSFVADLHRDASTKAIVGTIISLGRSLGVTITAEGVETKAQFELLRRYGCRQVQGFLFGRPADAVATRTRNTLLAGKDAALVA